MSGAANAIDEEWVEKKLKSANGSQDSVQSLSLWALNHKTQHEKIVAIWFKVLKTAKLDLRLTLFYLCNEVVQTCKRKHAIVFKDAFKEVLKDAALLVRDNSIRANIERIFKIWGERHVYNKEFVDELMAILNNTKVKSTLSTRLLAEFKPDELMRKVTRMAEIEEEVESRRLQLSEQDWLSVDVEFLKQQLKDRHECGQYADQADHCRMQLESYVTDLSHENQHRSVLIEMLEQSELFYDAQNSEAAIVATAYKNFGSRVNALHKKLFESRKPQKNSSRVASSEVEMGNRAKKLQDPSATPTEDEFDDDSCDELVNSSAQICVSNDGLSERSSSRQESNDDIGQRNSKDDQRSPIVVNDSVTTDVINSFGSLLQNLGSSITSCFLPSVALHSSHSLELSNSIHGFSSDAFSNIAPVGDEDAGGATPVQDEEPNDEISPTLVEFQKKVIQDSTKSTAHRLSTSSDHSLSYHGHPMELTNTNVPHSTAASWTAFDSAFGEDGHHAGTVLYDGYENSYDVVYHNTGVGQELSATAVYGSENVQAYEVYAPTYTDHSDNSQIYVVETGSGEGYSCSADGYETVVEAYPPPPPEAEYQTAYQEQLLSTLADNGYSEVGDIYSVMQSDSYQPQAPSESFYSVMKHVQDIAPQPSVMFHPVQGYAQPPPTFPPSLSLAPTQSFSHPPPSMSQSAPLTFIQPASFAAPPPLNQPPPPLFTLPQNSSILPQIPQSFIEPQPPTTYRLISPSSLKTSFRLPSPPVLRLPSPSALDTGFSNSLASPPFRMHSGVKLWNKKPYDKFKADHGRDSDHFENVAGYLDAHKMGRNAPNTRRTNLTYLTTDEDRNGLSREHRLINLATTETKSRYPSTALRSLSLPCDAQIVKSSSTDQTNGQHRTESPRSASCVDAFTKSRSSLSMSDSLPAQADQSLDGNDFGLEGDDGNMLSDTGDGHEICGKSLNNNSEDSIHLKRNTGKDSSQTQLTVSNIPSLGISSSLRTLRPRNWTPRLRHCQPELGSVRPLGSFRFRADAFSRLPKRPHFVTQQMPFQRNF